MLFNSEVYAWNTSSVTDMSYTFFGASSFNGDISTWDVAAVKNLTKMVSGIDEYLLLTTYSVLTRSECRPLVQRGLIVTFALGKKNSRKNLASLQQACFFPRVVQANLILI